MVNLPGEKDKQTPLLGVDTLTGSENVKYWSGQFAKWFPVEGKAQARPFPDQTKAPCPSIGPPSKINISPRS